MSFNFLNNHNFTIMLHKFTLKMEQNRKEYIFNQSFNSFNCICLSVTRINFLKKRYWSHIFRVVHQNEPKYFPILRAYSRSFLLSFECEFSALQNGYLCFSNRLVENLEDEPLLSLSNCNFRPCERVYRFRPNFRWLESILKVKYLVFVDRKIFTLCY